MSGFLIPLRRTIARQCRECGDIAAPDVPCSRSKCPGAEIERINARIGHIEVNGKPLDAGNPIVKRAELRR